MIWINLWLGKYHILSILDSLSPNPHVFLASHVKLQEYRVIKKISKTNPFFKQLKIEAEFLSGNKSKLIPKLYDVEEDRENIYLVEEYVEGVSLASEDFLMKSRDESELIRIAIGLFDFLKFINSLEKSVLYIDWKPGNMIFTNDGLKVIDFGSVIYLDEGGDYTALATAGFAAPELIKGGVPGSYTDVFGFGSMLKYLAEKMPGRRTFLRLTAKERLLSISEKCTNEYPGDRPNIENIEKFFNGLKKRDLFPLLPKHSGDTFRDVDAGKIAVCGAANGIGTTHVALCLAKKLADKGRRVAYVSLVREEDMGVTKVENRQNIKNVQIFKQVAEDDITLLIKKGFDNLILDFGRINTFSFLFYSCEEKILVVQNNFVKGSETEEFLKEHRDDIGGNGWKIIDDLSDETQLKQTEKLLKKLSIKAECLGMGIERI